MTVTTTNWQHSPSHIRTRTFAVGDVHGCAGALKRLLQVVNTTTDPFELIFLGDLIDRGPHNLAVLDQVWNWRHDLGTKTILPGNHELMMLLALQSPLSFMPWWKDNGGETVLNELNVNHLSVHAQAEQLQAVLATKLLDIIDAPTAVIRDGYLFVHGGVPMNACVQDVPVMNWHDMSCQNPEQEHPLWMRDAFLMNVQPRKAGIMVVHGHTPTARRIPELHTNRINVDGGSCFGGNLCMAELMADQVRFHVVPGATPYYG